MRNERESCRKVFFFLSLSNNLQSRDDVYASIKR